MSSRPPSSPPRLPGYEYEQLLGSGGFADVFLYRQFRPQRRVAIKVLLSNVLDESVRQLFDAEANVMAQLSTHPSIVAIHQAEVSDDHRPYIVMEYCPRPNYGLRFRTERITVAEALRVGVQIAGAVETAHRAGILHRDIKPANILLNDYNRPALTDFGISVATAKGNDVEGSQGMSIPWSPPEFFADPPWADARSDVFSLAATVYSLLAGRTPFERAGQRNTASDLIHRIATDPLRPLDRPDIPAELNRVLAIAMAKDPSGRYDTALALGRGLQQVEQALALPVTPMDVLDDRADPTPHGAADDDLDNHTRIRRVSTVDPETGATTGPGGGTRIDPFAGVAPALGSLAAPGPRGGVGHRSSPVDGATDSTMLRPAGAVSAGSAAPAPPPPHRQEPAPRTRSTPAWPFVTLAGVLIVLLGVGTTLGARHLLLPEPTENPTTLVNAPELPQDVPDIPTAVGVEVVTEGGDGTETGRAKVVWEPPAGYSEEESFQARWKDVPGNYESRYGAIHEVHGRNSIVLEIPPQLEDLCAEVRTVNANGQASDWVPACLETG
ncbi:serine/threonine-protein kinase [Brachybacterium saurashtrense]|uniref:non-specific serine/threonine protein kinase n=1 Tax=Brachybacterium saurashtrense TaxID=556288 RepID=A0A345YNU4_9MICO|nr:serine/threonine-protein kinase [Brachybacterium saurashtrense]AXK45596.1 serine/threonine protein kinase [Brachybacterium saurashtrense]RRR21033.1 serine/threonine protein kinase [Brachybacterium saurashtrense]